MNFGKRTLITVLTAVLFTTAAIGVSAAPQSDAADVSEDVYSSFLTVQERLDAIEAQRGQSEAYLSELNSQLNGLTKDLNILQGKYSEKRTELDTLSHQLMEAEQTAEIQRRNMAVRIQYIYENSIGIGYLDAVFSGEDFMDFLNRASDIQELTEFDRAMLDDYLAVCEEIEDKRAKVQKEQEEIEKLEQESLEKRNDIQTVYEETLEDINEMAASIEAGHEEEARLLNSIQEQEARLSVYFTSGEQQVAAAESYAAAAQNTQAAASVQPSETAKAGTESEKETGEAGGKETASEETAAEETAAEETAAEETETAVEEAEEGYSWDGPVLTKIGGVNQGPTGKETYYNLNMGEVVNIMRNMGNTDEYWVREDGVKMLGDYVMVAADLEEHPRGSIVDSSLGEAIVVDTGYLEKDQLDIAVTW